MAVSQDHDEFRVAITDLLLREHEKNAEIRARTSAVSRSSGGTLSAEARALHDQVRAEYVDELQELLNASDTLDYLWLGLEQFALGKELAPSDLIIGADTLAKTAIADAAEAAERLRGFEDPSALATIVAAIDTMWNGAASGR